MAKLWQGNQIPIVPGFRASGIHCGIKPTAADLALISSDVPAAVAGVFTRSTVVGAPVVAPSVGAMTGSGTADC